MGLASEAPAPFNKKSKAKPLLSIQVGFLGYSILVIKIPSGIVSAKALIAAIKVYLFKS